MRYYVTGSNGFIGKHVVDYLANKGYQCYLFIRPLQGSLSSEYNQPKDPFEFIHLSAYGNHYNQTDIGEIIKANILDLQAVIKYASHAYCTKLYNISTSAIQLTAQTPYSMSKAFGESMVNSTKDRRFVNVRPYSVYGPGEAAHRFIPTVIRALHSGETIQLDENARHDWIYIDDFIDAMFDGHTNIGTGQSYSNWEIVDFLEIIACKKLHYEKAKLRTYDTTDWVCKKGVPHRPIYEGLKQTYEASQRHQRSQPLHGADSSAGVK